MLGEQELERKKLIVCPHEQPVEELLYTRSAKIIYSTKKSTLDLST
jgi:hypothetical protein